MKTIALRFGEHFAPECGTIAAHQQLIDNLGFVWYGKMSSAVSAKIQREIMKMDNPQILLIRSGKSERYWAYVLQIQNEQPSFEEIPSYYRKNANSFKTWFKINSFETASKDVMSHYVVSSSRTTLGNVSKHSMRPYFIIEEE